MNDVTTGEIAAVWDTVDLVHRQAIYIAVLQHRLRDRDETIRFLKEDINTRGADT